MTDRVQLVAIAVSLLLLVVVLELVRRRKLVEEYSIVWILCGVAMLVLSAWRDLIDGAARVLGVFYPPSVLLLLLVVLVFVALLWFSVILSAQRRLIERLAEETAVLGAEVRELRAESQDRLTAPGRTGRADGRAPPVPPPPGASAEAPPSIARRAPR